MKNSLFVVLFTIFSSSLCGLLPFDTETWESGYIPVENKGDKFYYFLFKNRENKKDAPLIIWLNGGPGCSSLAGLFQENGPVYTNRTDYKLYYNPYSWNNFADVLYVDQPVTTGLSVAANESSLCHNEICICRNFYSFFLRFLDKNPEYIKRDLYFSGESYAGRYIPAIAAYFAKTRHPSINLRGVAIGNPFTHMSDQLQGSPLYLQDHNLINKFEYLIASGLILLCKVSEQLGISTKYLQFMCDEGFLGIEKLPNPYNINENKGYEDLDAVIEKLMNNDTIKEYLKVDKNVKYEVCNDIEDTSMAEDVARSQSQDLEYLLENGYEVMLYFGLLDYVCNWRGGVELMRKLNWKDKKGYFAQNEKEWRSDGKVAGEYKKYANMNFVTVRDSGHMVPLDQPEFALTLIKKYIMREFD